MKNAAKKRTTTIVHAEFDPGFTSIARAFEKDRDVSLGKIFGSVGLKVNGKVFAMVVKGSFVVKLPKSRVDELVDAGGAQHFDPGHGKLMKEWVAVPAGKASWLEFAREAHRFVKGGAR